MKNIIISTVRFYQNYISWDHFWRQKIGGSRQCRFYPSCSDYLILSINKQGIWSGILSGAKRILRCNPFNHGGVDYPGG